MTQPDARAEVPSMPCNGNCGNPKPHARHFFPSAERTEPATGEDVMEILSEAMHTAFRKASNHPRAIEAWEHIAAMPNRHWAAIVSFVAAALDLPKRERALQIRYEAALLERGLERDTANAELTKARAQIEQLRADRTWEQNRANEAARLSAEARDRADDLAKELAAAREHADIVEQGRFDLIVLIHRAQEAMPDTVDPEAELDRQVRALVAALAEAQEDARQAWFYLSRSRAEVAKGIAADIGRWIDDEVPTEFDEVEEGVTMTHRGRIYRPRGFFHLGPDPRKPYRFVLGWGTINFRGENYELNYDQFCVWLARDNKKTIYLYRGRWRDHRD